MFLVYLIAAILALYGVTIYRKDYEGNRFDIKITHSINGIFIILVFCRHIFQYINPVYTKLNLLDDLGSIIDGHLYQLLVVPFLFFSAYGLTISAERNGGGYVNNIPRRRCLTVLLNFMLAVCCFAILQLILGNNYNLEEFLLSLICWDSLGNSNWYIFCILWCYFFSYIGYKVSRGNSTKHLAFVWFLSLLYIAILHCFKGSWWYDTVLAYPTGVTFTIYKDKIINYIKSRCMISIISSLALFLVSYICLRHHYNVYVSNVTSIMMCMLIIALMIKVRIQNKYLEWMGKNLFPLYIYMRIPMILFSQDKNFIVNYEWLYIILCIVITLAFGYAYKFYQIKIK